MLTRNSSLKINNYNNHSPSRCTFQRLPNHSGQASGLAERNRVACVQPRTSQGITSLFLSQTLTCKREREREERDRERERERGQKAEEERGRRKAADPGRERRQKQGRQAKSCAGLSRNWISGACRQGKEKKGRGTRAGPQKRRRRRRRGRGREGEKDRRNAGTRKRREELPVSCTETHTKRTPRTIQKHLHRKKWSSCPKPSGKRAVTKKNPKNEAKTGRTFLRHFRGPKTMAFQRKKAPPPPNPRTTVQGSFPKTLPKGFQTPTYKEENFCQAFSGTENPTNMQKHRQNTTEKHKAATRQQKTIVRSRKWISKTKPKKKRIFAKHFREQKTQQICKTHRQNTTEKHKAATRQQEQRLAPENGSQKPNLRRREFLPRIFGNRKPNKYAKT